MADKTLKYRFQADFAYDDNEIFITNLYKNGNNLEVFTKRFYGYYETYENGKFIAPSPFAFPVLEYTHCSDEWIQVPNKIGLNWQHRVTFQKEIKLLRTKFAFLHEWVQFRKKAKQVLFTPQRKIWYEVLKPEVARWFSDFFEKETKKTAPCCDNFRVAYVWNTAQKRRYKQQQASGCCGFYDEVIKCPIDNKYYHVGFNYGH